MIAVTLYVDATDGMLLASQSSAQYANPRALPFNYGDTMTINLYFYQRIPGSTTSIAQGFPFSLIPPGTVTPLLMLYDGTVAGAEAPYAQCVQWIADPTNSFVTGTLDLSTAPLEALIGAGTGAQAWLGIGYIQAGNTTTAFRQQVNVGVGVLTGAQAPIPGLTPLSKEAAVQLFLPIQPVAGQPLYLATPHGKVIAITAVDDGAGGHIDFSPTGETI